MSSKTRGEGGTETEARVRDDEAAETAVGEEERGTVEEGEEEVVIVVVAKSRSALR